MKGISFKASPSILKEAYIGIWSILAKHHELGMIRTKSFLGSNHQESLQGESVSTMLNQTEDGSGFCTSKEPKLKSSR